MLWFWNCCTDGMNWKAAGSLNAVQFKSCLMRHLPDVIVFFALNFINYYILKFSPIIPSYQDSVMVLYTPSQFQRSFSGNCEEFPREIPKNFFFKLERISSEIPVNFLWKFWRMSSGNTGEFPLKISENFLCKLRWISSGNSKKKIRWKFRRITSGNSEKKNSGNTVAFSQ